MQSIGRKLKEIMTKFEVEHNQPVGNKIKIPTGSIPKNSKAIITCTIYSEIPYKNDSYNF